ncbi:DMT family transporter [Bacteriovoracaceae bacterium]|nr:DMT family transporter [Bacteriovoracaceae bacterium]
MRDNIYLYAVASNLFFALGSQVFAYYSRKFSSLWMNFFKATIAIFCFSLTLVWLGEFSLISLTPMLVFLTSGFIGLGMGDVFLLNGFAKIGPGRTMVLFSFQPLIIGILSYFLFDQSVDERKLVAIFFFLACIIIFAMESFRATKKWDLSGILYAFIGMTVDAIGILLTRYAFDYDSSITAWQGNFYRTSGAILFFILLINFKPINLVQNFKSLHLGSKSIVIIGAILGTFLSLGCYLIAIQQANLATLTALSINATIFASLFECIIYKKWPSRYLIISFIFFFGGMNYLLDLNLF